MPLGNHMCYTFDKSFIGLGNGEQVRQQCIVVDETHAKKSNEISHYPFKGRLKSCGSGVEKGEGTGNGGRPLRGGGGGRKWARWRADIK